MTTCTAQGRPVVLWGGRVGGSHVCVFGGWQRAARSSAAGSVAAPASPEPGALAGLLLPLSAPQIRGEWQHPMMNNAFTVPFMTLVVGSSLPLSPSALA